MLPDTNWETRTCQIAVGSPLAAAGSRWTANTLPSPTVLWTDTRPPCASACRVRDSSPRAWGQASRWATSAGTAPDPRSRLASPHTTASASTPRARSASAAATVPLAAPAAAATRTARAAPGGSAGVSTASASGGPTVTATTEPRCRSASRSAHSRAASSASDAPLERGSVWTAPVSGSTCGRRSTHLRATTTVGPGRGPTGVEAGGPAGAPPPADGSAVTTVGRPRRGLPRGSAR